MTLPHAAERNFVRRYAVNRAVKKTAIISRSRAKMNVLLSQPGKPGVARLTARLTPFPRAVCGNSAAASNRRYR